MPSRAATPRAAAAAPRRDLRRSVRLFRAFLGEQRTPDHFYSLVAADLVQLTLGYTALRDRTALDLGCGRGDLAAPMRAEGARVLGVDLRPARGPQRDDSLVQADATALPLTGASVDVVVSSNLLEHVADPSAVLREVERVLVPGGTAVLSWTPRLSPWAGHETSPWHYLGPRYAVRRFEARTGRPPHNLWGSTLFGHSVGAVRRTARARPGLSEVDVIARYHPAWAVGVIRVPVVGEVLGWNALLVLRRR